METRSVTANTRFVDVLAATVRRSDAHEAARLDSAPRFVFSSSFRRNRRGAATGMADALSNAVDLMKPEDMLNGRKYTRKQLAAIAKWQKGIRVRTYGAVMTGCKKTFFFSLGSNLAAMGVIKVAPMVAAELRLGPFCEATGIAMGASFFLHAWANDRLKRDLAHVLNDLRRPGERFDQQSYGKRFKDAATWTVHQFIKGPVARFKEQVMQKIRGETPASQTVDSEMARALEGLW